jgi:hypothetical protein
MAKNVFFSSLFFINACRTDLANTQLPKPAQELTTSDANDSNFLKESSRWQKFLEALQMPLSRDEAAIRLPSALLRDDAQGRALLSALTDTLADVHMTTANRSSCAEVVELEDLGSAKKITFVPLSFGDLTGAHWYLMKYKRKTSSGESDTTIQGALLSVPDGAGPFPVIAHAHAGDEGLNHYELAAVYGNDQLNYIIVAPAFPGEGIFATKNFPAVGTSDPYSTDAEDLLAAHNCLIDPITAPAPLMDVRNKIKRRTSGPFAGAAVSATVGVSRGGMTSLIAHAKNEALLRAGRPAAKRFSCAATAINPTSLTFGEFRVYLEATIRGSAELTGFYTLPTAPQLNDVFKAYRTDSTVATAESAALELQKRDATFNAQLILSSLRNWSNGGPGSLLMMHGTLDQKIPISQGNFGAHVFTHTNRSITEAGSAPGVQLTALAFVPQAIHTTNNGKELKDGKTMHGDEAWFTSQAKFNAAVQNLESSEMTPLTANDFGSDKMPLDVLSQWLADSNIGCASTY